MKTKSKSTQDLQENKSEQKPILVMDIATIPKNYGMDIEKWNYILEEKGICFYDSTKGNTPFYSQPNPTIKMYDVQEEEAMSELESILAEDDIKYEDAELKLNISDNNITITGTPGELTPEGVIDVYSGDSYIIPTEGTIPVNTTTSITVTSINNSSDNSGIIARFQELTDEAGLTDFNNITEGNLEQVLENTPSADLGLTTELDLAGPLTDQEVTQLSVNDPRGVETRASRTLTSRRGPSVNRRLAANNEPSFELTDDTV